MDLKLYFLSIYNEKDWCNFASCFEEANIKFDGIPQDIINVLYGIIGSETDIWLNRCIFDNNTPIELSKTDEGIKALKAFIMRMPI